MEKYRKRNKYRLFVNKTYGLLTKETYASNGPLLYVFHIT